MIRYKRLKIAVFVTICILVICVLSLIIVPTNDRAQIAVTSIGALAGIATVFAGSDAYRKSEYITNTDQPDELP